MHGLISRTFSLYLYVLSFCALLGQARLASLYSSSVTYCSPPDAVIVQRFDVRYFQYNTSLVFDITASTTQDDLNVTALINLNAYGLQPVNLTINLCELNKALCPLPMYNFSGFATVPVPQVGNRIPGITWVVPDLEAAATLQLVRIGTNDTVACIQATLSNGWSLRMRPVSWAIGGFTLATFLLSLPFALGDALTIPATQTPTSRSLRSSITPLLRARDYFWTSPLQYRWLTVILFVQHIVSTAFLHLNYPVAYRSFATNFAWSFGLFAASKHNALQHSLENLRGKSGSKDAYQGALSPLIYANRQFSPYNEANGQEITVMTNSTDNYSTTPIPMPSVVEDFITPPTVNISEPAVLQAGVPMFTNSIEIPTGNAFLSLFIAVLTTLAIFLAAGALGYTVFWFFGERRRRNEKAQDLWTLQERYVSAQSAVFTRVVFALVIPVLTLVFFQWTIGDSWLAVLFSVITLLALIAYIGFTSLKLIQHQRRGQDAVPFTPSTQRVAFMILPYTEQHTASRWYYTVFPILALALLKAMFTSFAKGSGLTQVIAFIIIELTGFGLLVSFRPGINKGTDVLEGFVAIVRIVTSGLLLAFVESLNVKPIPRAVLAFAIAILESIVIIVLFVNVLWNLATLAFTACRRKPAHGAFAHDDGPNSGKALDDEARAGRSWPSELDLEKPKVSAETPQGDAIYSRESSADLLRPQFGQSEPTLAAGPSQHTLGQYTSPPTEIDEFEDYSTSHGHTLVEGYLPTRH